MATSIALDDEIHTRIKEKQTELIKTKNKRHRMIDLNNYIATKGLENFNYDEFLSSNTASK